MLTKADMKTRRMLNTPTRVLFMRDWTIFFETVCIGDGKSCAGEKGKKILCSNSRERKALYYISHEEFMNYLYAGIYGTDKEDVGEDDEDTDIDSQHDRSTGYRWAH